MERSRDIYHQLTLVATNVHYSDATLYLHCTLFYNAKDMPHCYREIMQLVRTSFCPYWEVPLLGMSTTITFNEYLFLGIL